MRGLAADVDAAEALAAAARAGPYFTLEPWTEGTGWRPTTTHNVGVFNDGGTPETDARAQAESWVRMIAFLMRELN